MDGQRPDNRARVEREAPTFDAEAAGEAREDRAQEAEPSMALFEDEPPATFTTVTMEAICEPANLARAFMRVQANRGAAGVDGMTVDDLPDWLREHWPRVLRELTGGAYRPAPVRRVEIPKPDGGKRKLGIPTALDRLIQQAILQVMSPAWDATFCEHSYGFRPNRTAHQAVARAQALVTAGREWVVDIDLESFFDRVNHDRLMASLAARVKDRRVLRLVRAYLSAGVMEDGLMRATPEGTPQGGPLSPLLSNIVLDELDRELERRGHAFVRYADDCNVYVRSEDAGHRVMESLRRFITKRLKLKVNESKSAVDRPSRRKFLGFSLTSGKSPKRRIAPKAIERFKDRIRELTRRTRGIDAKRMVEELSRYLRGWLGYFGFCETPSVLRDLDSWIRRRMRAVAWKQWKHGRRRFAELVRRGVPRALAAMAAGGCKHPWRASRHGSVQTALPSALWDRLGLVRLAPSSPDSS